MAGAGGAALWLGGCGGSSNTAKPVAGDEWKQFAGTTLNFISENTAPTSAIAANLAPFKKLTGIDIKITQLELAAMVQKVALDFASGQGAYQIVYADPYQVLAPYHEALVDLNTMMRRPQPARSSRTSATSSPSSSTPPGASSTRTSSTRCPTTPRR